MPFPLIPLLGSVVSGGASVISNLIQGSNVEKANRESEAFQEQMYGRQRADALADRDFANSYNSPAAQMARLKAAGLNPNLVAGGVGGGSIASSESVRSSSPGSFRAEAKPAVDLSGLFMGFVDVMQKQAQTDNIRASVDLAKQELLNKVSAQAGQEISNARGLLDLDTAAKMQPISLEQARQNVAATAASNLATNVGMFTSLSRNEREAAMNAADLKVAAQRLINMKLDASYTQAQIASAKQALVNAKLSNQMDQWRLSTQWPAELKQLLLKSDNVAGSNELQSLDIKLKQLGIQPHDPAWIRMLTQFLNGSPSGSGGERFGNAMHSSMSQMWDALSSPFRSNP